MEKKTLCIITIILSIVLLLIVLTVIVLLSIYFFRSVQTLAAGPKIIIDHDGGADDAMAIFMALLYEQYYNGPHILGLTTVHGNVKESQAFENSQRILSKANRGDVPIYRGVGSSLVYNPPTDAYFGEDGLGDIDTGVFERIQAQPEHAAMALINLSKKYDGEIIVIAIGSLSNIAVATKLDPHFISRLSQLYVGAGNIYSTKHMDHEFNAFMDVEAYHIVAQYSTPDKVTIIPFSQIMDSLNITREWRQNVLGAIPTNIMTALNMFERISIETSETWAMLDPAVMAVVLNQQIVGSTKYSNNSIILCGEERALNTNELTEFSRANVQLVYGIIEEYFKQFLIDIFSVELVNYTNV